MLPRHLRSTARPHTFQSPYLHQLPKRRYQSTMPSPPKLDHIAVSIDSQSPSIAIIKFNRPKSANAINTHSVQQFLTALNWAEAESQIRIILTTGEGKFYTAGLDLLDPSVKQEGATISDEFIDTIGAIHEYLIKTNKLVVSAINGPAPGWGTTSIALSDLVYAAPNAIFFTPFVQWGLCAEGCSSLTMTRLMGRQKASALILAGARFTAQEAESAGLITKILGQENFSEDVMKIVRGIAKLPPDSLKVNKDLLMRTQRAGLLEANEVELRTLKDQVRKKESLDAIAGFAIETERKKKEKASKSKL
ncbi:hypothetical protein AC579_3116 [Pseudocercospora musae]|uniref:Uncharacterized protein n=1 Tax=Pseudocercospora musae TaxID=113226 RepID=A0A139IAL4_9PEZI|nr:hypothetical protein AC579_3116 [Pseudocercospora musae]